MYFNIRDLLRIEKETRNPIHNQVDIRDYYEAWSGKVIAFTSYQKYYIQEHFNIVFDLNQRDRVEYTNHNEINGNLHDFDGGNPGNRPKRIDKILDKYTCSEWLLGWTEVVNKHKVLSISSKQHFRKFVHNFEVHKYGYIIPELIYRFAALEGQGTDLYVDTTVGDTYALDFWRNTVKFSEEELERARREGCLETFGKELKAKIKKVFAYFEEDQPEDLKKYMRPDPADIRPKSHWEPSARYVKWLQTRRPEYKPSRPYQRVHYENISEGTQTDVTAGHYTTCASDRISWPYLGEKYFD